MGSADQARQAVIDAVGALNAACLRAGWWDDPAGWALAREQYGITNLEQVLDDAVRRHAYALQQEPHGVEKAARVSLDAVREQRGVGTTSVDARGRCKHEYEHGWPPRICELPECEKARSAEKALP